jgi:ribonuclease D
LSAPGRKPPRPQGAALSAEEVNRLPLGRYRGPVRIVTTPAQVRKALRALGRERVLGFDTETRAAFRKGESYPPALLQLAAADAVWLVRLNRLKGLGGFAPLLSDGAVLKTGVALERDVKELRELEEFEPGGFLELEKLSDEHGVVANGLRGMAACVLGLRVSKGAQRSNWARGRLSDKQIEYAATDAWICRQIYLRLTQSP